MFFIKTRDYESGHAVHNIEWKPPDGDVFKFLWSGERLTKIQATTRLGHLWPVISSGMSEARSTKGKQQRDPEKLKLDNARKLRGICVMDPGDEEFKETIQKSWNCLWKQLCLVRSRTASTGRLVADPTTENQSMHASQKLARNRLERTLPKDREDRVAGKGSNSLSHYNLVHKVHSFSPINERFGCKCRGQRLGKAKQIASMANDQGKEER